MLCFDYPTIFNSLCFLKNIHFESVSACILALIIENNSNIRSN